MRRGLARLILLAALAGPTGLVAGCSDDASAGSDGGSGGSESPTPTSGAPSTGGATSPTDPTEPTAPVADPGTPEGLLADPLAMDALAVARVQVLDLTALSPQTRADLLPGLRQRSTGGFQGRLAGLVDRFASTGSAEGTVGAIGLESLDEQSAGVLVAATSPEATDGPDDGSYLFRVSLGRAGDTWLVDDMQLDDVPRAPSPVLDDTGLGDITGQVEQLLSYTPRDVLSGLDAESDFMTDEFARTYRRLIASGIAPQSQRRDITTTASVRAAGLSTGRSAQASLLVVVDLEARLGSAPPEMTPSWVTVDLRNVDGTWLIDGLEPL